jgi:8-oxo-dGTP pyrophosphatase MutT (NUDIX family)
VPEARRFPVSALRAALDAVDIPDPYAITGPAAVLVLVAEQAGQPRVLLIERPQHLPRHPGQIACPGGRFEPEDVTLWRTALREAEEEVGISPAVVERVGLLRPVRIRVSGFTLVPCVGYTPTVPALVPAAGEVARVLWVPLDELRQSRRYESWGTDASGRVRRGPAFRLPDARVWGATAIVLAELLERVDAIEREAGESTTPP